MSTLKKLEPIFHDMFENSTFELGPETTAKDVEEWDSLQHIRLMLAIEVAFGIKFATGEISSYENVGELVTAIERKVSEKSG